MKTDLLLVIHVFLLPLTGFAQEILRISFDGPPVQAPGTAAIVQSYAESGFHFFPLPGSDGFVRQGGYPLYPNDGSDYLQALAGESLSFDRIDRFAFDLVSMDLAGYSTVVPDSTVHIIGYRLDGSVVTTDVDRHGIDFQTYFFSPNWSDLVRVAIPTDAWSLDNVVLAIPEPDTYVIVVAGGLTLWMRNLRVSKRNVSSK